MTWKSATRFAALAALVGGAFLSGASSANAAFSIRLESDGDVATATDGGAGDADLLENGTILYAGSVGDFSVNGGFATSNSADGVVPAQLSIINTSISSSTASDGGVLTITLTDTDFTAPGPGPALLHSEVSFTQGSPATVAYTSAIDGDEGTTLLLTGSDADGREEGADDANIAGSTYTLSSVAVVTVTGPRVVVSLTGLTEVSPVPEPATVMSLLVGLPLLGLAAWARKRRTQS